MLHELTFFVTFGILALLELALIAILVLLRRQDRRELVRLGEDNRELVLARNRSRDSESAALQQLQWYRAVFSNTTDMVLVYGVTADGLPGTFLDANDTACTRLDHPREKLLGMSPLDIEEMQTPALVPHYSRAELITMSDEEILGKINLPAKILVERILTRGHVRYEQEFVTRTGKHIPVEVEARRLDLMGRPTIMCTAHDLTGRRLTERALRDSEQRFYDFFKQSPIGVALFDAQRNLVDVNLACLRMFGIPDRNEFVRFNLFDNPFVPASSRTLINRGESVRFEADIDFDLVRNMSLFVSGKNGRAHYDILINNLGLDSDYNPKGYLVQTLDITKRRSAELALRQIEKQLRQSQKMEAIGTLAGGIAHDFNNILTPILGYSDMILYQCREDSDLKDYIQEVIKASLRAKDLVTQILTFSRQTEPTSKAVHVAPILKEVLQLQRAVLPETIDIQRLVKTDNDIVMADPTQVHQILMNLCTNAAHAMRESGGVLEVRLGDVSIGARSSAEFPHLPPGRYLRISVRDTGTGMSQPTLDRIFEPFFTTKAKGEGTGMGLSVVHGIVTVLKGAIKVESEPGKGSTFHIALPSLERKEDESPAAVPALPSGSERVLLVDDEPDVIRMEAHMLATLGYQPVVAHHSDEALRLFELNPGRFDLVITDQVMPEMTGTELAAAMLSLRPDTPIILCTGYADSVSPQSAQNLGIREILMKPVSMLDMASAIRRVLGVSRAPARPGRDSAPSSRGMRSPQSEADGENP